MTCHHYEMQINYGVLGKSPTLNTQNDSIPAKLLI